MNVLNGDQFHWPVDEKPKSVSCKELKRVRNILLNPRVSVVVDDYEEDWSKLAFVSVQGVAEIVEPNGEGSAAHRETVDRLRKKYSQYRSMAIRERPLIRIQPTRIRHWSATN